MGGLGLQVEGKHCSEPYDIDGGKAWLNCIQTLKQQYDPQASTDEGLLQESKWLLNFYL